MQKRALCIVATLLLAVTFVTLSGIASAAATLAVGQNHSSCCDVGNGEPSDDDLPGDAPCSSPDCLCLSCIAMILPDGISLKRATALEVQLHVFPQRFHMGDYAPSIEYPPENA